MKTITLPGDLEAWAKAEVAAGRAESVEALVEGLLREQREVLDRHQALVEEGYASIARGDVVSEEEMDAELDRWIADDFAR